MACHLEETGPTKDGSLFPEGITGVTVEHGVFERLDGMPSWFLATIATLQCRFVWIGEAAIAQLGYCDTIVTSGTNLTRNG